MRFERIPQLPMSIFPGLKGPLVVVLGALCLVRGAWAQNWTQQSNSAVARAGAAMVYDPVRHQTVLFGGQDGNGIAQSDTWVYDGANWLPKSPGTIPPARVWHAMAFDANSGNIVMFGGCTSSNCSTYLGDTWLWNGTNWLPTAVQPLPPAPRQGAMMSFFPNNSVIAGPGVVLYGGSASGGTVKSDTWVWDGTKWNSTVTTAFQGRFFGAMSYDPNSGNIVLFGGENQSSQPLSDTWLWNGTDWSQPNPPVAHIPPARFGQGQVFDPVRQLTVMFGGSNGAGDTWTWNGQDWGLESTHASPSPRQWLSMVYDIQHADTVVFGGLSGSAIVAEVWTLGYTYTGSWTLLNYNGIGGPAKRENMAAASDGGLVYLFGGFDGASVFNDTWEWDGNQFSHFLASGPPSARQSASMALSLSDGAFLLFGGNTSAGGTTLNNETWLLDSSGWHKQTPAGNVPTPRQGYGLATDAANFNVVLFGGDTGAANNETWVWASDAWVQKTPAHTPGPRTYPSMVFDGARNQVVMFGGYNNGVYLNETWVWNGTDWTQLNPLTLPPQRYRAQMVYDSVHGTVLLNGGQNATITFADTWVWDGVNWNILGTSSGPVAGGSGLYDSAAQQFLLFGGTDGVGVLDGTLVFTSPYVPTATLPTGVSGQPYSYTIVPSGGQPPYTFTQTGEPFQFSAMQNGLTLNPATGAITGTDQIALGQTPIGVGVNIMDSQGQSTIITFTLPTDSPITFTPGPTFPDATTTGNYHVTLSASGGTPPYVFSASNLPPGLTVSGNAIVGSCTASSGNMMLAVTDSLNGMVTAGPFTLNCNPAPVITNATPLPPGKFGTEYNIQFETNAIYDAPGAPSYTWSAPANTLPPGMTLGSSNGVLSGLPTALGTTTFTVTFTDHWGATVSQQFQVTIGNPFAITTKQLALGNVNIPYPAAQSIAATGGAHPYHFTAGNLPPGIGVDLISGAVTGTPTAAGTFLTNFTVTDASTAQASLVIPIYVAAAGTNTLDWVHQAPIDQPGARAGAAMFYDSVHGNTIAFGGNNAVSSFYDTNRWNGANWTTLSPANNPPARTYAAAAFDQTHGVGVLFGGLGAGSTALSDTWLWDGANWTLATPVNKPPARVGAMMAWDGQRIVLFGGILGDSDLADTWTWDGTNWNPVSISNPPGQRDSAGIAYDSFHNKVVMFGGYSSSAEGDYFDTWIWDGTQMTWTNPNPAQPPSARDSFSMVFDSLHNQVVLFGGFLSSSFNDIGDTWSWDGTKWTQLFPPHNPGPRYNYAMIYDPNLLEAVLFGGTAVGSPTFYGNDTWTFGGPIILNTSLPTGTVGSTYNGGITLQDAYYGYTYSAPTLPPGLTFNAGNGTFGGMPTTPGNYSIPLTVQDTEGVSITPHLSVTINPAAGPLTLIPTTLPDATAQTNYNVQLSATGGVGADTFFAQNLPAGLLLNSGNQIGGFCTAGSNIVTLKVQDSASPNPDVVTVGPLTVNCQPVPQITNPGTLPNGVTNAQYQVTFQANGGSAPLKWSLTQGTLPANFTINSSTGVLTGTVTNTATEHFSVTVTDRWGATSSTGYQATFYPPLTFTTTALPNGVLQFLYPAGATVSATGGTGPGTYTFGVTNLAPGLSFNSSTGAISGTPTQAGTFHPFFTVTDQASNSTPASFPITVAAAGVTTEDWLQNLAAPPAPRQGGSMFYDSVRNFTILFGGLNGTGYLGDTDSWDGSGWTTISNSGPSKRVAAAVAFDPVHGQGVLFGGGDATGPLGDTWLWNGQSWSPASPNPSSLPTPRSHAMMAWDGHHIVLFGGAIGGGDANDTWIWDGTNWAPGPIAGPGARDSGAIAFDSVRNNVVLFGGYNVSTTNELGDTWLWNGSAMTWTKQTPANSPTARTAQAMVFDTLRGQAVIYGGYTQQTQTDVIETWAWNGQTWTILNPPHAPLARDSFAMAYDQAHFQAVLFSGINAETTIGFFTDTWLFGGPVVPNLTLPVAPVNQPYSANLVVDGGFPSYTFSVPSLPPGITFNAANGTFGGTPTSAGTYTIPVTIQDSFGDSIVPQLTLQVSPPPGPLTLSPTTLFDATVMTNYLVQLSATGGVGAYTFQALNLPPGLTLNSSNQIVGQCTAGSNKVLLVVNDSAQPLHTAAAGPLTVNCEALPSILTPAKLPDGLVNTPYSVTLQSSGGSAPIGWFVTNGSALPPGLLLGSSTGTLTGTPTAAANYQFSLTVQDTWTAKTAQTFSLTIAAPLTITTASPLPPSVILVPYSTTFAAAGGIQPYKWSSTGLPGWLQITQGVLFGTPPAGAASVSFQVTVTDSASTPNGVSGTFTLPVNSGVVVTSTNLPLATVNTQYSTTLTATGGSGSYTWTGSGVPAGLTLASNGVLSGKATTAGPYSFQVTATDASFRGVSGSAQAKLLVSTGLPLSFATQSLASCLVSSSCSNQIAAAGGVPPYIFSLGPNPNLDGLTFSSNGLLSGSPSASGQFNIPVVVTDQQQTSINKALIQTVIPILTISSNSLPPGTVGVAYGSELAASGGTPPYTWSLTVGSLPAGLSFDALSGIISGTPTAAGTSTFSVQVGDGQQLSPSQQLSLTIAAPAAPLTLVSASQLTPGMVGTGYALNLLASGGGGPYTWTLTGGSLPAGLSLAANGLISGTPTTAQAANFNAKVTSGSSSINSAFAILITNPAVVSLLAANPLPNGAVGVPYDYPIQVTGGTPPYFFSITQGQVPPGLIFDATNGTLSGTPTSKGNFAIVLTVTDSGGSSGASVAQTTPKAAGQTRSSANYTIQIAGVGDFQITTGANLPNGTMGQNYATTMMASGGTQPYQWQLMNGILPPGLALNSNGQLTGTPSAAGSFSVLIRATDNTGLVVTNNFNITIANPNVPVISPTQPPAATVGVAYQTTFTALGGKPPYTWSVGSGIVPPGLSLDPRSGTLSGTPTTKGVFGLGIKVTDAANASATQTFTFRANAASLQIAPQAIPGGVINAPYSTGLTASGGTAPYIWSLSAGSLPSGFSIDSGTGIISGTPTQTGTDPITISVMDSNFDVGSQNYQFSVQAGVLTISTTTPPAGKVGTAYSYNLLATNVVVSVTWSVASGSLPPGITLGANTGQLSGTPTAAGSYTFTVQVKDGSGATASAVLTMAVNAGPLTVTTTSLPAGAVATAYSQTLQGSGGQAPVTWSVVSGSLPAGLTLAAATGVISGTPTSVGSSSFTVQAKDSTGTTATLPLSINVAGPPAAPAVTISGLPATSNAGDQPSVTITLGSAYPLPIVVTATLSISPSPANSSDLMFSNGSRTTQITIPAGGTTAVLPFQVGTLPGTVQVSLALSAAGVDITPAVPPSASTKIAGAAPVIKSVAVATTAGGIQVTIIGWSTTLDMKTAAFHFTAASGATLQTTDLSVDVSGVFAAWYGSAASQATGSQFSFTIPFTISGNVSAIASMTVTMTNSVGSSTAVTANVP